MKFKNLKLTSRWPYLFTIFGLSFLLPMKVLAVNALTKAIIQPIWDFFVWPMTWGLQLEMELLRIVARYNNFTSEGGVELGWIALRDLSNMFFILILLVIAFATILRISNYGYQQLLKRTLIIAIVINFSKSIVGFAIDIVQVVMLTFISAIDEVMSGGVVVAIGLHKLTEIKLPGDSVPFQDYIVSLVFGAIFLAILLVVMGIMVMMLTMRIVALWVAIVLSPLAFVASIFPATKSFYSRWIKELGSNLVSGPMLAFFMWLTFTIVGNGDAYRTFMGDQPGMDSGATTFLGTANMVNYIVAISLLLMGIKMAASSGAAGASFADKGSKMIQNSASRFARRYPKAALSRLGAGASSLIVNRDGDPQRLGKFTKAIPFYGGRLQRGAMKAQGKYSAMIGEFKAEDEKYINPKQRRAFEYSQRTFGKHDGAKAAQWAESSNKLQRGAGKALKKVIGVGTDLEGRDNFLAKGIGKAILNTPKAYSLTSSLGGSMDRDVMYAQNTVDRDEVADSDEALRIEKALTKVNDQERLDKLRKNWGNTYTNDEDADRTFNESDAKTIFRDQKAEAALDEKGNVQEGSEILLRASLRDTDSLGLDIGKALLAKLKAGRVAWTKALMIVANKQIAAMGDLESAIDEAHGDLVSAEVNEQTGAMEMGFNNKGALELNSQLPLIKLSDALMQSYPQQAAKIKEHASRLLQEALANGTYNFDDDSVKHIRQGAKESDTDFEARKKQTEEVWQANNKQFATALNGWAQSHGINSEEDWTEEKRQEWQASEEHRVASEELYSKRRELMNADDGDNLGTNYVTRALLKSATDGMDYSRLQEMDLQVPEERRLFEQLAKVATQDQQRQLLQEANPDQIKLFAEALAETGQKLNKVIMDNLTPGVKREVAETTYIVKEARRGVSEAEARAKLAELDDAKLYGMLK